MNFADDDNDFRSRRRHQPPDFWHGINRVLTGIVVLAVIIGVGVMFYPVWRQQQDMRSHIAGLEQEKAEKTALLAAGKREIYLLQHNPDYVETIARDRLNLMKEGETIFRVELPPTLGTSVQP
ncbi:MAG: FtsB family cell division protein [Chthoniobacterales bacterium]|jgi:cell division protein FtsB